MLIFLQFVNHNTISVECQPYTLVEELRLHVFDQLGIDVSRQRLIYKKERMMSFRVLSDYGIINHTETILVFEEGEIDKNFDVDSARIAVMQHN